MKTIAKCEHNQDDYENFLIGIQSQFDGKLNQYGMHLFRTDVKNLFQVFLDNLPENIRQHYTCNACRKFVNTYGNTVFITSSGETVPAMWGTKVPELYYDSVETCFEAVRKAKITGCFIRSEKIWGTPITGEWNHMAVTPPPEILNKSVLKKTGQIEAEKKEDFKTLIRGLVDFNADTVKTAVALLQTESLYRSEKCIGVAEWLHELHSRRNGTKNSRHRENLTWLAVASAPPGWCHIRSTIIGTLLEDIASGKDYSAVSRRFAEKMHPLQYQRPSSQPSDGNIEQAEKIVIQMGIKKSLERRFAKFEEVPKIWTPSESVSDEKYSDGVFSHLKGKSENKSDILMDSQRITWKKFSRTVLPKATRISYKTKSALQNFCAVLTAVHDDAPPILQWDSEDQRNPFSLYLYSGGSHPSVWNLPVNEAVEVTGVCFQPSMFFSRNDHQGKGIVFLLKGCRDSNYERSGNALFPEILKSELHQVRKTIEAFSRKAVIHGYSEASACGIVFQNVNISVIVRLEGLSVEYTIDRWE